MNDRSHTDEFEDSREIATTDNGMVGLIAAAEIDQQIATAHRYPRSLVTFRREALQMVTLTEVIAQECIYALKRGEKTIQGPSARFAEIMLNAWGNARAGARVVHEDEQFVTSQGVCHDLQRNVAITFEVRRRITDSKGKRYNADMIGVTSNAASSIALRNCILKVIPKAFWSELYTAALKTGVGDVKTLSNKRLEAIAAFQHYGITEAQILTKLGRVGVQDIGLDDLLILFGLLTAIKDNETTPEDAFADEGAAKGVPGPQSKSAPAASEQRSNPVVDHQQAGDPAAGNGAAPKKEGEPDKPLGEVQMKIIRAKLKNAALSDMDLTAKFGPIPELRMSQFQAIQDWTANPAPAK